MGQFDTFTERARACVLHARDEALRLQHDYVGTEHLLLGLLYDQDELAARALNSLGVELVNARLTVERTIGRGPGPVLGNIDLSMAVKRALNNAIRESRSFEHHYVGTEHVLLGLVHEPGEPTKRVLDQLGLFSADIRSVIADLRLRPVLSFNVAHDPPPPVPDPDPFGRLTEASLLAMQSARDEATRLGHDHVGVVHLLIGLMEQEGCAAARVLSQLGLTLTDARATVDFVIGRGTSTGLEETVPSPRLRSVVILAAREAERLGHDQIGTGHLLLGLAHAGNHIAAGICEIRGVRLAAAIPILEGSQGTASSLD